MPVRDELGKRIKKYEAVSKTSLMRRTPVIIRIDGKAFHTFTKGFKRPFDEVLIKTMQETAKYLCENVQGCVFGYTQSDEISLVLIDYQTLTTDAWFDNEVQKISSIAASMTTMAFNKFFEENIMLYDSRNKAYDAEGNIINEEQHKYFRTQIKALDKGAMFDARCFNVPREEVVNCIYWRQLDASRNSVQMVGQAHFSQKELHEKTCGMIQDMLYEQKGINWNDYPVYLKRGTAIIKVDGKWEIDLNMPQLKGEDRKYLEELIYVDR